MNSSAHDPSAAVAAGVALAGPPSSPGRTATRPRIPVVDGVRAVAMFMVFTCHVGLFSGWPALHVRTFGHRVDVGRVLWSGANGVDLFMVLSGFCLFLPLCRRDGSISDRWNWRTFYRRRATRILPAYYGAIAFAALFPVALVAACKLAHVPAKWPSFEPARVYVEHMLFLQTFVPSTFGRINAAFWSMGLEVQFYVVFPAVVAACRRRVWVSLAGMVGASVTYLALVDHLTAGMADTSRRLFPIFFLGRWVQFATGMAVAWLVVRMAETRLCRTGGWGTAVVIGCAACYVANCYVTPSHLSGVLEPAAYALMFGTALFALCVSTTPLRKPFEHRLLVSLGLISYSFFLLHWPIIYYLSQLAAKGAHVAEWWMAAVLILAGFPIVAAVAWVSFQCLERPFLGHLDRPGQAKKPVEVQIYESANPTEDMPA